MSNISQIQVGNTTYDIKDTVARDEKINKSEIAEPYDSTKTYNAGDIFERDGVLCQVNYANGNPGINIDSGLYETVIIGNMLKHTWTGTLENLITFNLPANCFAFTTNDNEKIWFNTVFMSKPNFSISNSKWATIYGFTAINNIDGVVQWGVILAKNDLTGIDNIDDANNLLKIQKVDNNYVVTYANSTLVKKISQGHKQTNAVNVTKGTSPIAYIRGYAVFKNDDNTETVMYTPCKLLSWEET